MIFFRNLYRFGLVSAVIAVTTSCTDKIELDEFKVDKPISIAQQEEINSYDPLKSYINGNDFTLGAAVSISGYNDKGAFYRLVNQNFEELTAGYGMKHGAIVSDAGSFNFGPVENFLTNANEAGLSVYGHTLVWHANQNAEFLNSTIAPIPAAGPAWVVNTEADFETDDASNYLGNNNAVMSFTANGEGANGDGRALKITNDAVRANDWDSQFFITFSPNTEVGDQYELQMDVRADQAASFPTQAHVVPYQYKHWNFFGTINATTEWQSLTIPVTITAETSAVGAIAFNLGATATSYYFDNIFLMKFDEGGGGGPALDPSVITNTDFEGGTAGWGGWGNGSTRGLSADGEGYGGSGFAYTFTNPSAANFWEAQIAYDLAPLELESTYVLNFRAKANTPGTIRAEIQSSSDYSSDALGTFNLTQDWTEYTLQTTLTAEDRNRFIISYGDYAGTVYIDDITLRRVNPEGGGAIEKTPEEKADTLSYELERWISGMMEVANDYVNAWDVVNEPMDDGNPYELKTGVGKELAPDEFYWQDYLGKDYAVMAFNLARQYGDEDDLLFINDYNLEYNLDKCQGLIDYVEYIENQGATVDGIGTQMHISIDSDKEKISQMFQMLAATGKMIKVSELDVRVNTSEPTEEILQEQAEMYKYVVDMYKQHVPAPQQYGITVWGVVDSTNDASWLPGEKQGLWNLQLIRKPAYVGFAEGLKGL